MRIFTYYLKTYTDHRNSGITLYLLAVLQSFASHYILFQHISSGFFIVFATHLSLLKIDKRGYEWGVMEVRD